MENFRGNSYSIHGHFRAELFIIPLVFIIVVLFVLPNAKSVYSKIRRNSAIDGASSYRDGVDSFFVSQLLLDSSFKLDGTYIISSGNLINGDYIYNIPIGGNIPDNGYLSYSDNNLISGCIGIDGYSVIIENGGINAFIGSCDIYSDVAYGM